jgi:ferredoxin
MAKQNEAFYELAKRWHAPGSEQFVGVLEAMLTPEEGKMVLELWTPMTCDALATKLNLDKYNLRPKLDTLAKKGVVSLRKDIYSTQTRMTPLMHATVNISNLTDKLWTDFFLQGGKAVLAKERYDRRMTGKWSVHRILPALQALAVSPHIRPEEILWYENLDELLKRGKEIMFSPCICRRQYHLCDNKVELCMHVTMENDPTPFVQSIGNRRIYTYKEALEELYASEDAGMCHLSQNHPHLRETCNCCGDCCRVISPLVDCNTDYDLNDPTKSRFQASVNQDACNGCQTCMGRCMFDAIEMVKVPVSKKLKAKVIAKKCMGCGLCVYTCEQKAIRFDIVRPPIHIPNITREQAMGWAPATQEEIKKAYQA